MTKDGQQTSNEHIGGKILGPLDLINELDPSHTVKEYQAKSLDFLIRAFRCPSGQFILTTKSGDSLDLERITSQGISTDFADAYRNHLLTINQFHLTPQDLEIPVITGREIAKWSHLQPKPYFMDMPEGLTMSNQLIFLLIHEDHLQGAIYIYRPEDAPQFTSSDKKRAEAMIPYLNIFLHQTCLRERELGWIKALDSLADDLPYWGLVLIDPSFEVVYANSYAHQALCIEEIQIQEGNRQAFLLPEVFTNHCRSLIETKEAEIMLDLLDFKFCTPSGNQEIAVHLRRLSAGEHTSFILASLHEIAPVTSLSQELKDLGISLRELDVILLVYQGLQNSEIAQRLSISEHTVENHLRSIYEKLKVNSRTGLIHQIIEMGGGTSRLIPIQDFPSL